MSGGFRSRKRREMKKQEDQLLGSKALRLTVKMKTASGENVFEIKDKRIEEALKTLGITLKYHHNIDPKEAMEDDDDHA